MLFKLNFNDGQLKTKLFILLSLEYCNFNNARALLFGLVNVCAFLNKPRLISLTLQI